MANWMHNVGAAISKAVDDVTKPGKSAKSATTAGASRSAAEPADGLSENSRRNVHDMLKAGMLAVAEKVETRFTKVEGEAEEIKVGCVQLEARLAEAERLLAKQRADHDELKQEFTDSKANFENRIAHVESMCAAFDLKFQQQGDTVEKLLTPSSGPAQSQGASAPMANANCDDIPYHLRVVAKIGGFVFDTDKQEIITTCKTALSAAGVDESTYKHLHCPRDKGSWAFLTFNTRWLSKHKRLSMVVGHFGLMPPKHGPNSSHRDWCTEHTLAYPLAKRSDPKASWSLPKT